MNVIKKWKNSSETYQSADKSSILILSTRSKFVVNQFDVPIAHLVECLSPVCLVESGGPTVQDGLVAAPFPEYLELVQHVLILVAEPFDHFVPLVGFLLNRGSWRL